MLEKEINERRMVKRMTDCWSRIKKDEPVAPYSKFNNATIQDLWDNCFILSVEGGGDKRAYKYIYVGRAIKNLYGKDLTNQRIVTSVKNLAGLQILKRIDDCVDDNEPVYESGQFVSDKSKIIKFRSCLLPFAGKGGNITNIVGGLSWKTF